MVSKEQYNICNDDFISRSYDIWVTSSRYIFVELLDVVWWSWICQLPLYHKLWPRLIMSWLWNRGKGSNCSNTHIACFVVESDIFLWFVVPLLMHYKLIWQDSGRIIDNQVKNESLCPQGLNRFIIGNVPAKLQPRLSLFCRYWPPIRGIFLTRSEYGL